MKPSEGVAAPAPGGGGELASIEREREGLHTPSGRAGLGLALTLTTVTLWAVLPVALKIALSGIDALTLTWSRFVAATLILGTVLFMRGALPPLRRLRASHWRLLAIATLGLAGNYAFYVLGLDRTNASTAQVLIQIAPVLLAFGGIWVFHERFGVLQWTGLVVMVAGLVVFSRDQIMLMLEGLDRYYAGIGCLVIAGVSWATYALAQKQLLGRMSSASIMLCLYAGSALLFTPIAEPRGLMALDGPQLGALVFCVVNMLVSYGTFSEALAHWDASRVSAVLATVPLATLLFLRLAEVTMPTLVAPEPITAVGVVGAVMVVAGSLMTALGRG